jgi:hypothetical protein
VTDRPRLTPEDCLRTPAYLAARAERARELAAEFDEQAEIWRERAEHYR